MSLNVGRGAMALSKKLALGTNPSGPSCMHIVPPVPMMRTRDSGNPVAWPGDTGDTAVGDTEGGDTDGGDTEGGDADGEDNRFFLQGGDMVMIRDKRWLEGPAKRKKKAKRVSL